MPGDHALEHVAEIGIGLDAIEPGRGDEGRDHRPAAPAAVGPSEEMVLACEGHGPDRPFDRIVVELDAAIVEEAAERGPPGQRIADRVRQPAAWR